MGNACSVPVEPHILEVDNLCQCVIFKETEYCTQRELADICPRGFVYLPQDKTGYSPDSCLCPVNLRETAKLNGYRTNFVSDPFNVIFFKDQEGE